MSFEREIDKGIDRAGESLERGTANFFAGVGKGIKNLKYDEKERKKFYIGAIIVLIGAVLLELYAQNNQWYTLEVLKNISDIKYINYPVGVAGYISAILFLLYLAGSSNKKEHEDFMIAFEQCGLMSKRKIVGMDNKSHAEFPRVMRKIPQKDGGTIVIIKNVGIPVKRWKDNIEALEASLEVEISELRAHKGNPGVIELKYGGAKLEDMIPFEHSMLENLPDKKVYVGEAKNETILLEFASVPHLLVGGSTGSGKSVVARFIAYQGIKVLGGNLWAIDFKGGLEFAPFEKIGVKVCWRVEEVAQLMNKLTKEMKARLDLFREEGVKNIDEYNEKYPNNKLKKCFIVVDELAELMDYKGVTEDEKPYFEFIEAATKSIARLGRAPGIHLILATQRPSADVVDGQIKNNVTGRLCGYFRDPGAYRIVLGHQNVNLDDQKGRFIFSLGNKDIEIQTPYFKDTHIDLNLRVDYSKGMLFTTEESLTGDFSETPSVAAKQSERIRHY